MGKGSRNRARSRAIRTEMARTGENYTRAAAAVGGSPAHRTGSRTDAVREHAQRILEAQGRIDRARDDRAAEIERRGRRIITGGQVADGWEITDWRTGELIARGDDGIDGYDATAARLDPNNTWYHADRLYDDEPFPEVATPGIPPSLGAAIDEWIGQMQTLDEEIAEFVGWPVEKVREHR